MTKHKRILAILPIAIGAICFVVVCEYSNLQVAIGVFGMLFADNFSNKFQE